MLIEPVIQIDEEATDLSAIDELQKELFPYGFFIDNFAGIQEIIYEFWKQAWNEIAEKAPGKTQETRERYERQKGMFPVYKEGGGRYRDDQYEMPAIRTAALRDMFLFTEESKSAGVSYVEPDAGGAVTNVFITGINVEGFVSDYPKYFLDSFLGEHEGFVIDMFVSTDKWLDQITELIMTRITTVIRNLGLA